MHNDHDHPVTTILTLRLDSASQERFDAMRTQHYPPHLNQIAAHVTLFHTLPGTQEVRSVLQRRSVEARPFTARVNGLRSLGRGVAFTLEALELMALHRELAGDFEEHLSPQDRQKFQPHVVIQNKVTGDAARTLQAELKAGFSPWTVRAVGLDWWDYLGGPWRLRECFAVGDRERS